MGLILAPHLHHTLQKVTAVPVAQRIEACPGLCLFFPLLPAHVSCMSSLDNVHLQKVTNALVNLFRNANKPHQ